MTKEERLDLQRRIKEAVYDDLLLLKKKYADPSYVRNLDISRFDNIPNLIKVNHPYVENEVKVFSKDFYKDKIIDVSKN